MGTSCGLIISHFMFLKSERWIANLEDITTKKHLAVVKIESAYKGLEKEAALPILKYIRSVHFQRYQLTSGDIAVLVGVKQLKEIKKVKLKGLRGKLATPSAVIMEQQFYVVLPTAKAHKQYHETGGPVLFAQRIHPLLVKKIIKWLQMELLIHKK